MSNDSDTNNGTNKYAPNLNLIYLSGHHAGTLARVYGANLPEMQRAQILDKARAVTALIDSFDMSTDQHISMCMLLCESMFKGLHDKLGGNNPAETNPINAPSTDQLQ